MANAVQIAAAILTRQGELSAMKLQKLVYYAQAWSLVWDERPLFDDRIEAWANGPVIPSLFNAHRGRFKVSPGDLGEEPELTDDESETISAVLKHYGDKTANWLSDLTHREEPWIMARVGLDDQQRGNREISHASMAEYYGNI